MQTLVGGKYTYQIDGRIGEQGKFGGIYLGTTSDKSLKVSVKAITNYNPQLPEILSRLQKVENQYIASVIEWFVKDECLYIVREYIDGFDLKTAFANKRLMRKIGWKKIVLAGISVLKGLSEAHKSGIVHRDIKPSNVVVRFCGTEKYETADFSNVALIDFEQASLFPDVSGEKTPFALIYSPPEMLLNFNNLVCPASDLFSVGILLFQLISGGSPYPETNPEFLMNLQLTYPIKKSFWMKDSVYKVISKATHKQSFRMPPSRMTRDEIEQTLISGINGRYSSADEMITELEKIL